jgi:alpha-glucosidase
MRPPPTVPLIVAALSALAPAEVGATSSEWSDVSCYHVYIRSFKDTNGDGVGDLNGVREGLNHIKWLGANCLYLSPVYDGPNVDWGYDVSDYYTIHPDLGTLEDFDRLVFEAKKKGMYVIMDYVPNHTSSQHPWFVESASSSANEKADWYVWADPVYVDGLRRPPTDDISIFDPTETPGSAWTYVPVRNQYYFHFFLPHQPDVNWDNADVREAMFDVLRFWYSRGVDGLRVDAINTIYGKWQKFDDWDAIQRNIQAVSQIHDVDPTKLLLLESFTNVLSLLYNAPLLLSDYYGTNQIAPNVVMWDFMSRYYGDLMSSGQNMFEWKYLHFWVLESLLPGDPHVVIETSNHDDERALSYFQNMTAPGLPQDGLFRAFQTYAYTEVSIPVMYYGNEIGMTNPLYTDSELYPDYVVRDVVGRDGARSPMQWTNQNYAGFSEAAPWLPVNRDHVTRNVRNQRGDSDSLLRFHKSLMDMRNKYIGIFGSGEMTLIPTADPDLMIYLRTTPEDDGQVGVLINFGSGLPVVSTRKTLLLSDYFGRTRAKQIFSSEDPRIIDTWIDNYVVLEPFEAIVVLFDKP